MQLDSNSLIILFGAAFFLALALILFSLRGGLGGGGVEERMQVYTKVQDIEEGSLTQHSQRSRLTQFRWRINSILSGFASRELALALMTANWPITETEFTLIRFGGAGLSFFTIWFAFGNLISGIGLALMIFFAPNIFLQRSLTMRRIAFERQLVDTLILLTNSIRAGFSLLQAVDVIVSEMPSPASEEWARVRREVTLGLPLYQALTNLNERIRNDDLSMVITAININTQVGGNLVTMLESVTRTIRERVKIFSEVRVLTSQQRYNSYLLTLLPVGVGALMLLINPDYMSKVLEPGPYLCFPIGAVVSIILGNIVVRRLGRIEI